ncbi:hypothetical protein SKTS_13630 [Sulfurimicrobium lacus]|uniref:Phage tail protein n=1 Tax=Sulfurimicrobium lacus TaxID=2715678 RepID=A0A6F8VBI7_9PROT|nr:phage tail tube protein [Sulfurimicrobium lacus]BCB26477.1 hypothetical protein SKTS_13630 [Sulfurimicrobium lacus]
MTQVFGRAFITVAGKRYNTKAGASLKFGGIDRKPVIGDGGVAGFQETIEAPEVDCTIIATGEVSLAEIQKLTDFTLSFDTDTGRSYVIANAFNGPVPELSNDGIKAKFYGIEGKEV